MFAKMVRSLVVVVVLCVLSLGLFGNANAAAPVTGYRYGGSGAVYPTPEAACNQWVNAASFQMKAVPISPTINFQCQALISGTWTNVGNGAFGIAGGICPDGSAPNTSKPTAQQCVDPAPNTCRGEPSPEAWLNKSGFYPVTNPTCTWMDAEHVNASCSGTSKSGKPTTVEIGCRNGTGVQPGDVPSPEPEVEVDYPECPVGSYKYTDIDGASECSTPIPEEVSPPPCTSGNVGTVNGKLVCLPANPAPDQAAVAAAEAKLQAAIAKQFPATPQAAEAAKKAAAEAQKAKDAANSLPSSAGAQGSAQDAINSAKQAAGYAGTGYGGPGGVGNGTGSGGGTGEGDTGPKECGTPGKPKCQIDETGTPAGVGTALDASKTALQTAIDAIKSSANEAASDNAKDTSIGWLPNIPEGTCQEVDLPVPVPGGGVLRSDICKYTSYVTVGFELLWAAFFAFAIMAMVASATSKSHS